MSSLSHPKHSKRIIAILIGVVLAVAIVIGLSQRSDTDSGLSSSAGITSVQQDTDLVKDGDVLDSIVKVPTGTYLVVKSDQGDQNASVQVTENGGFVVEKGAVLVLENVSFSGDGQDRSMPVFSVYGDMVMNGGTVENFSGTSSGTASDYGTGGVPAICVVDGTFTMNGGVISGNTSTTTEEIAFGGALRAEGRNAAVIINDGTISGNRVLSSATVPDDSTVTANALGGAIAVTEGASVTINGGEISDNTAGSHDANGENADNPVCSGNGGAIAVYSSDSDAISSLYLDGGSIVNNNAYRTGADQGAEAPDNNETHGGGIFSNVYTKAVLNAGRIAGNTSDDKGGGVFLDCAKSSGGAVFKNTLVSDNEAAILGGGLWFCPNGESYMFSDAKADGIAVFDNTTARRGTDGAGDDLYVSPRSGDTGVTVTDTMPGGGSNEWYQDGGAGTQKTSSSSSRYTSSDTMESATLLQASAIVNRPSVKAKNSAVNSAAVVITGNRATYGGGVGSNHFLSFGTPTKEEEEEHGVPAETLEPEKISINVNKVWVGDAGTEAKVHLYANGVEKASAALTADNDWSYTFTGFKMTNSNGEEIQYTLTEDPVDGYTSSITGDASIGFTVTNTENELEKTSVTVRKNWVGDEGTSATVHLLANGTEAASATLTADNDWSYTFTDLDKNDADGTQIAYTIEEDPVDGYTTSVTGSAENGFVVTNTKNEPGKTSVTVTKNWVGDDGTSATVHLLANGEEAASATLTADNDWSYTFTDLDQTDSDGNEIAYTLTEDAIDGYASSITGDASSGFTITNTKKISIPVTKKWVGDEGSSATVHLFANGTEVDSAKLTADDDWSYTFTDLDQAGSDGNEITYTLTEDAISGYESSVTGDASSGFTVTNTETINITGTKVWNDNDDQDGLRPDSVTISLLRDGTVIDTATVTADEDGVWSFSFDNKPKYDSDGNEYNYNVTESETDIPDGYTSTVFGSVSDGYTITNTHTPATTSISVSKTWDDADDQDGLRPDAVTVQLYADGEVRGDAVELTSNNDWTYTWSDLSAYSGGEAIEYSVAETEVPEGYTSTITDNEDGIFTITNTHTPETTSVKVTKEWVGPAGTSATFSLSANGTDTGKTLTLTADDGWSGSFSNLDKYSAGEEIAYTVEEADVPEGYNSAVSGNMTDGFTVTNTSNAKVGVRVIKDWRGMPEAVTVNLYGQAGDEDAALVKSVTLDGVAETLSSDSDTGVEYGEDDAWVAVFTGLPKYDSQTGDEITYSVTEDAVSETSSVVSEPVTEGDVTTFTITNTRSATFQPTVTKEWGEGVTSKEVTIQLKQGDEVVDEITLDGEPDEDAVASDTGSGEYDSWQGRFSAVDKYDDHGAPIEYTVSEVTTGNWQSSVSGNARTGFTVLNAPLGATSATLAASKTVNDGEVGGNTFSFELYEGDSTTGTLLQTVQNDHDGVVSFDPIVYTTSGTRIYTIVEKDEGAADVTYDSSVYTATVEVADADGDGSLDTPTITYSKDGQEVSAAAFDNTVVTRTSVSFTKAWVGAKGDSATVRLMRSTDGGEAEDTGLSVTVDGTVDDLTTDSATGAMYGEDAAWHGTFQNLVASDRDHTYSYTLVEDAVDGYASSSSGDASEGYVFTNTELTSVSGTKTWDDASDQDGLRPDSVTVSLLRDGTEVDTAPCSGDGDGDDTWSFSFDDLAKYDSDGNEYTYTVTETDVPDGYTSTVSGYTITNTHTPETTSVSITKSWDDADDQDGLRPSSVTVQLYAGGEASGDAVTLSSSNSWSYTWSDLDAKSGGEAIEYTVGETEVPDGYTAMVSGDASTGYTITNSHTPETTSVSVTKSWDDADNQDGLRPGSVTVQLYAGGEAYGDAVTLSSDNSWSYTWSGLDAYSGGTAVAYTVEETDVPDGYTATVSGDASTGLTITNTHTPETTSVSVTKSWDDADDQDGLRPSSVTVQLYAGGEASGDAVTLSSSNSWSYTWSDLDAKSGGEAIEYTVEETDVPDGYTATVSGDASTGLTITNTHTPETTSVSVTKSWDDADNQDGLRPGSVTVQLYAGGEAYGDAVTLGSDNNWTYTWSDLDANSGGEAIAYTVAEADVPNGYKPKVTDNGDGTFTVTNTETTSVTVTKAWNDNSDVDGLRPDSVTVQLYAGDDASGDAVTLSSSNSWTYTWTDLPKYDSDGDEIAYTLTENAVDGYTSEVSGSALSGFTITNTHEPETVTVHVQKNWSSYYGEASVVVELYSDGEATGSKLTLVSDENDTLNNGWNGDFSNLPKYDSDGDEIEYTVVEEEVYWPNDSTNYREYYSCTPNYTTSGNTINCTLGNKFVGGSG